MAELKNDRKEKNLIARVLSVTLVDSPEKMRSQGNPVSILTGANLTSLKKENSDEEFKKQPLDKENGQKEASE